MKSKITLSTVRQNGRVRRATWAMLSGGFLIFVMFSLLSTSISTNIASRRRDYERGGPFDSKPFKEVIVHLDLKGAPPKMNVYKWFFPLLKRLGVNGVLMEYEDMFPYSGELRMVKRTDHYSEDDIGEINRIAAENSLEIIPLVQTFGHMEFILKHSRFAHLRENPLATRVLAADRCLLDSSSISRQTVWRHCFSQRGMCLQQGRASDVYYQRKCLLDVDSVVVVSEEDDTICPSDTRSMELIRNVIEEVRDLHPNSSRIHVGADEAYHIAEDDRCRKRLAKMGDGDRSLEMLKLNHIGKVAELARDAGFDEVFAWNDMFDKSLVDDMRSAGLGQLVVPVVWGYKEDVTKKGYFPDRLFERFSEVFPKMYFASAFKGAVRKEENYINVDRYLHTQMSYVELYKQNATALDGRVGGIFVTGWQRYAHHSPLCELLAISIPSIVIDLAYLDNTALGRKEVLRIARKILKCPDGLDPTIIPQRIENLTYFPHKDAFMEACEFEGHRLFKLIMRDLHLLSWKVKHLKNWRSTAGKISQEIDTLAIDIITELRRYYFDQDVIEFVNTKISSLKEALYL